MKKFLLWILGVIVAYVLVGALVDRVIFPEAEPGAEYYPPEGYVFYSKTEGFRQTVLKHENNLVWGELVLDPHAPGAYGARITYDIPLNSDRRAQRAAVEALPLPLAGTLRTA